MDMQSKVPATGLSVSELADRINVHRNTIIYWIKTGQLEARRVGLAANSPYTIPMSEVERAEKELVSVAA